MATRRPAPSPATSAARLAEIDAALAVLRERQAHLPRGESGFASRARLALLISAFERRRDLVEAALDHTESIPQRTARAALAGDAQEWHDAARDR